jgi:hypothetical protein
VLWNPGEREPIADIAEIGKPKLTADERESGMGLEGQSLHPKVRQRPQVHLKNLRQTEMPGMQWDTKGGGG